MIATTTLEFDYDTKTSQVHDFGFVYLSLSLTMLGISLNSLRRDNCWESLSLSITINNCDILYMSWTQIWDT